MSAQATLRRRLLAGLALGFVVVVGLILVGDFRQVAGLLADFSWQLAPLVLAGTLFNYLLRFFKWHYYLSCIGVRGFPLKESARLFVAGFPLAVTPGKVGEALKGVWLHQATGTATARGITVVLAERISDGLAVLVLSSLGVIAYPRYWPAFATVLGLLLVAVVLSQIRPLALAVIKLLERARFLAKVMHHVREFYEGTYALFRPRATLIAVSLGTLAWFGEGVAMYLVLLGLGVPPGSETLLLAVFILSFSTVIGAISALPGGLGAAEASIAGMLTLLMGLPTPTAAAATLLIRFATLWFGVTLGLIVWSFSRHLLLGEPAPATNLPPTGPAGLRFTMKAAALKTAGRARVDRVNNPPLITVELHCHSYHSSDSLMLPERMLELCRQKGIDQLAITDHNTIAGAQEAAELDPERVIVGEEILTTQGELLAFYVQEAVPAGLEPGEAIQRLREQGALIIVSHPLDPLRAGAWRERDLLAVLPLVDGLEVFNARSLSGRADSRTEALAKRERLLGTAGSDAHSYAELGQATMRLPAFNGAQEMRQALAVAQIRAHRSSPLVHFASRAASLRKQLGWKPPR